MCDNLFCYPQFGWSYKKTLYNIDYGALQEELNDETSVKEEFEDQDTTDKYEGR
jgi:hypothetical protein